MSNASLIANTQTMIDHDMRFSRTDVNLVLSALIVAEQKLAQQAIECNNARFELLRQLATAQAVIAEAQACLEQADQGDSFGPIEDILAQSPTDALQAHDRQVATKAVE